MITVSVEQLSESALLGVVDAFILREGTDYGHQDYTLDEKRRRNLEQTGQVVLPSGVNDLTMLKVSCSIIS